MTIADRQIESAHKTFPQRPTSAITDYFLDQLIHLAGCEFHCKLIINFIFISKVHKEVKLTAMPWVFLSNIDWIFFASVLWFIALIHFYIQRKRDDNSTVNAMVHKFTKPLNCSRRNWNGMEEIKYSSTVVFFGSAVESCSCSWRLHNLIVEKHLMNMD